MLLQRLADFRLTALTLSSTAVSPVTPQSFIADSLEDATRGRQEKEASSARETQQASNEAKESNYAPNWTPDPLWPSSGAAMSSSRIRDLGVSSTRASTPGAPWSLPSSPPRSPCPKYPSSISDRCTPGRSVHRLDMDATAPHGYRIVDSSSGHQTSPIDSSCHEPSRISGTDGHTSPRSPEAPWAHTSGHNLSSEQGGCAATSKLEDRNSVPNPLNSGTEEASQHARDDNGRTASSTMINGCSSEVKVALGSWAAEAGLESSRYRAHAIDRASEDSCRHRLKMARPTIPDQRTLPHSTGHPSQLNGMRCMTPERSIHQADNKGGWSLTALDAMRERLQVPPSPRRLLRENQDLAEPRNVEVSSRSSNSEMSTLEKIEAFRRHLSLGECGK